MNGTPRRHLLLGAAAAWAAVFVVSSGLGGMAFFHFGDPQATCASCHEMTGVHSEWSSSAHRTLHCRSCHGGSLTLNLHALQSHARRVARHVSGEIADPIRLTERDVLAVHAACLDCHPQTAAEWRTSRHTTTYGRIFLDTEHNRTERVSDDCLRCHGQFFEGGIQELVTPLDKTGPWSLADPGKAGQPALTCLACHQVHAPSDVAPPPQFYDRREETHIPVARLPSPRVREADGSVVPLSPDPRQRLCQQCHAPGALAAHRRGTSDDRTPTGVHAGLSCLDCHAMHSTSARASCASCHPRSSNCGLDVEQMDTTFFSPDSRHNIHSVACRDCHAGGVPKR